jgi:hypothetical protein
MNPVRSASACQNVAYQRQISGVQQYDADGRKWNGSWSWIQQDYNDLERLVDATDPIDWDAIGRQMNPIRTAGTCQTVARKRGMSVTKKDADGRKWTGNGWTWNQRDCNGLKQLVAAATEDPVDWDEIGRQMNPIRGASACQRMANQRQISGLHQYDEAGRKWNPQGWSWIQQDYDALERLVAAATERPIDWDAIGRQMNPIRSASPCRSAVKKMKNYERAEIPPPPAKKPRVE